MQKCQKMSHMSVKYLWIQIGIFQTDLWNFRCILHAAVSLSACLRSQELPGFSRELGAVEVSKSELKRWSRGSTRRCDDDSTNSQCHKTHRLMTHTFSHTFHTRFIFTWWVLMYWCIDVWFCWVVDHFSYRFKLEAYLIATGFLSLPSLFSSHRVGRLGILRQSQETVVNDLLQWDDSETPNGVQLSFWWWDCWITPVCHGKPSESGKMCILKWWSKRVINVAKCMVDPGRSQISSWPDSCMWSLKMRPTRSRQLFVSE